MEKRKIIFQSRGLPKRLQALFIMSGIVWISATAMHWTQGINYKFGVVNVICLFCTTIMGMVYVIFILEGRRLSIKIYDMHIEGCAEIDASLKDVYIPIDQICSLSSCTMGMAPHIMVRTQQGDIINFYMSAKKTALAEKILRDIIEVSQDKCKQ